MTDDAMQRVRDQPALAMLLESRPLPPARCDECHCGIFYTVVPPGFLDGYGKRITPDNAYRCSCRLMGFDEVQVAAPSCTLAMWLDKARKELRDAYK